MCGTVRLYSLEYGTPVRYGSTRNLEYTARRVEVTSEVSYEPGTRDSPV